jgi:asparagine synthase (glutamine-hydrolysing)
VSSFWGVVRTGTGLGGPEDRQTAERMTGHLALCGEGALQVWSSEGATFFFRYFRTGPAPQSATQPVSLDNRTWLIGDLRLDGRDDLITRLQAEGESCDATASDEELVLRAWHCWGESADQEKFYRALDGDFSFALWQPGDGRLTCFRDLMGSRPFFYSQCGERFCFSNRLEVLLALPWTSSEFDYHYLGDYLLCGWCADLERTAYRTIKRLAPGHLLAFSGNEATTRRFAHLPIEEGFHREKDEEYIEEYLYLLRRAVNERTPVEGAVVFMSGGLDSTTVAATASLFLKERGATSALHAIAMDYQPLFDDREGEWAARAARHIGIPLQVLSAGEHLPFTGWERLRMPLPEPRHEPYLLPLFDQYREAAQHARVALTGNGGDDILLGNAWPYLRNLLSRFRFAEVVQSFGTYFVRHGMLPPMRAGIRTRLRRWIGIRGGEEIYPPWLNPKYEREYGLKERWQELQRTTKSEHPLHPGGHALLSGPFWPGVLESENAFRTEAATETRAPLLDNRLLRFLLRIPPVPWCANKELLRRASAGLLPEEIRRRPKSPLTVDSVQLQISQHKWSPIPSEPIAPLLRDLIDEQAWISVLRRGKNAEKWSNHCPLSLNLWLKGIEKERGIQ